MDSLILLLLLQSAAVPSTPPPTTGESMGVTLAPGATRMAYQNGLPLLGRLKFPDGMAVRYLDIELEQEGSGVIASTKSGPSGDFRFDAVKLGRYSINIRADGVAPVNYPILLDMRNFGSVRIEIPLRPMTASDATSEPVVDLAQLKRTIHKDAVKAFENAQAAQRKGDTRKFVSELEKALKVAPDFYQANLHLGLHYHNTEKSAQAADLLSRAIAANPATTQARLALGEIYFDAGKFQEAVDTLTEAMKLGSASADLHFTMGSSHYKLGSLDLAEQHLQRAIIILPQAMGKGHLQLHNVYMRGRQLDKAIEQLDIYLQKFPEAPERTEIQSRLEKLRRPAP